MVKAFAIFLLTLISFFSNGEIFRHFLSTSSTEKLLQGEWNCVSILNEKGEKAASDLGVVDSYLKFNFANKKVKISLAPFDRGAKFSNKLKENTLEITLEYKTKLKFLIDTLTQDDLTLRSLNQKGEILTYYFKRTSSTGGAEQKQKEYTLAVVFFNDPAYAIIETYPQYFRTQTLKVHYLIANAPENYSTWVIFDNSKHESFSSYLLSKLKAVQLSSVDSLNNELAVDIEIDKEGVRRVKLVNPLTYELGNHVFDIFNESGKFWRLMKGTDRPYTLRFNILVLQQSEKDKRIILAPVR